MRCKPDREASSKADEKTCPEHLRMMVHCSVDIAAHCGASRSCDFMSRGSIVAGGRPPQTRPRAGATRRHIGLERPDSTGGLLRVTGRLFGFGREVGPEAPSAPRCRGLQDLQNDHQAIHDDTPRRNCFADTVQARGFFGDPAKRARCLKRLVPQTGLEPVTPSLRMTCSTN
jgi:hypothetical protein